MSIFNNKSILAWLQYFSENTDIDLATVRILDITGSDRNLMPARDINRDHFHRINSVSVRRDPPHCGFPPMRIVFPHAVYLSAVQHKIIPKKSRKTVDISRFCWYSN